MLSAAMRRYALRSIAKQVNAMLVSSDGWRLGGFNPRHCNLEHSAALRRLALLSGA